MNAAGPVGVHHDGSTAAGRGFHSSPRFGVIIGLAGQLSRRRSAGRRGLGGYRVAND
jgi:hypothetical protein